VRIVCPARPPSPVLRQLGKRVATGKCEGRKSLHETNPNAVALAKHLARKRPKGGQLSRRAGSAEMAKQGFLNEHGRPFNHKSIATMLAA